MREIALRDFFLGSAAPDVLATDVRGSRKKTGPAAWVVEIEDMETQFEVTRPMLVSLCDAVIAGQFPAEELETIGFALAASDKFSWDGEDLVGDVICDWSSPEVNYSLTLENVRQFNNWLLELDPYPPRRPFQPQIEKGRLISRTEKQWLPKQGKSK